MKLEIKSFANIGDLANERVVLRVLADEDIGSYALFRSKTGGDGGPIAGTKTAYWFTDRIAKAGDLVVLYTKTGKSSKKLLTSGHTAHFFYWHLSEPLWGPDKENVAVLLEVNEWKSSSPKVTS